MKGKEVCELKHENRNHLTTNNVRRLLTYIGGWTNCNTKGQLILGTRNHLLPPVPFLLEVNYAHLVGFRAHNSFNLREMVKSAYVTIGCKEAVYDT